VCVCVFADILLVGFCLFPPLNSTEFSSCPSGGWRSPFDYNWQPANPFLAKNNATLAFFDYMILHPAICTLAVNRSPFFSEILMAP